MEKKGIILLLGLMLSNSAFTMDDYQSDDEMAGATSSLNLTQALLFSEMGVDGEEGSPPPGQGTESSGGSGESPIFIPEQLSELMPTQSPKTSATVELILARKPLCRQSRAGDVPKQNAEVKQKNVKPTSWRGSKGIDRKALMRRRIQFMKTLSWVRDHFVVTEVENGYQLTYINKLTKEWETSTSYLDGSFIFSDKEEIVYFLNKLKRKNIGVVAALDAALKGPCLTGEKAQSNK